MDGRKILALGLGCTLAAILAFATLEFRAKRASEFRAEPALELPEKPARDDGSAWAWGRFDTEGSWLPEAIEVTYEPVEVVSNVLESSCSWEEKGVGHGDAQAYLLDDSTCVLVLGPPRLGEGFSTHLCVLIELGPAESGWLVQGVALSTSGCVGYVDWDGRSGVYWSRPLRGSIQLESNGPGPIRCALDIEHWWEADVEARDVDRDGLEFLRVTGRVEVIPTETEDLPLVVERYLTNVRVARAQLQDVLNR